MNALATALEKGLNRNALTENGALTNVSSLDACLDFFFVGPVAKNNPQDAVNLFTKAFVTNKDVALRVLQWVRDVRGGAGSRQAFRDCFAWLMNHDTKAAIAVLDNLSEVGRWDDLLVALKANSSVSSHAVTLIKNGLSNPTTSGLVAKWMPRKGETAAQLRTLLGMSPKQYRKTLVNLTSVVETNMCANDWYGIDYGKVPSVAAARYRSAFERHDVKGYADYLASVENGSAKINASAVFPHDVLRAMKVSQNETIRKSIDVQWAALPDYLEGTKNTGLVVADVSGSMSFPVSGQVTARDVCIGLAMYMAERARGPFKDTFITFSDSPQLQRLTGKSITARCAQLNQSQWSMSTNLDKVFKVVLDTAVKNSVPAEDMPSTITIISDMEFNCVNGGTEKTVYDNMKQRYQNAGYELPKIVFWNLKGRTGNMPVTKYDKNTALISGYSPAILTSLFKSEKFDPTKVMLDTVMNDRYNLNYR